MSWNLACPDWWERLQRGQSIIPDLPGLDLVAGETAVRVFNKLRLADVERTPTLEEAGGDWFRDIVRTLMGAVDPVTRARIIREIFLLVPKKNSKTTNGALLMLTVLLLNVRPRATFILTAPVQDVAELAFEAAKGAIELDPVLSKKLHVRDHLKTIIHRETKAELQIMTFDPAVLTGQKPVGVLIDEVHVIAKMAKAASAIRQLRGGMLPFPEAFMVFITTQSEEQPTGVFAAELEKARAIRDGKRSGAMLPILYEFPMEIQKSKDLQWTNHELWKHVTPNAGRSITIERLVEEMQTARDTSEKEFKAWASQHLNIQIGLSLGDNAWAGAPFWAAQVEETITFEDILERCEVVDVGIDGGGLDDLLALAIVGRDKVTQEWLSWTHAWCHRSVLKLRAEIAPQLQQFEDDGDLTIIDVMGQDIVELVDYIERVHDAGLLDKIGVDPFGIGSIVDEVEKREIDKELIVGISQGWKMAGTITTTERKLAEGVLFHNGSPMMSWCIGNAKTVQTGNARLITKQVSGTAKIDPLMALFDAITLMALNPKPPGKKHAFKMLIV